VTYVVGVSLVSISWAGQAHPPRNSGSRAPDNYPKLELSWAHRLHRSCNPAQGLVTGFGDIVAIETFKFLGWVATALRAEHRAATAPATQGRVMRSQQSELLVPEA
jgi:hypothetical protein